ncbi:MAG: recombination mediator RecR [Patescibacteria group bacterium]|nr:recombination mediator RecR [Patescibacteria group bacterium]
MFFPNPIKNLIEYFNLLPGIGTKTSEKFVFHLLKKSPQDLKKFGQAIAELKNKIIVCEECCNFSEKSPCYICTNPNRNKKIICVVAKPQDIYPIETTEKFSGVYHILGGTIDNLNGITPDKLNIKQLITRLKNNKIDEIILAFNPDIQGEETIMYLKTVLKNFKNIKITRLARGLPMGADLEYADEVTISNALKYRNEL